jgi:hypothetical protein
MRSAHGRIGRFWIVFLRGLFSSEENEKYAVPRPPRLLPALRILRPENANFSGNFYALLNLSVEPRGKRRFLTHVVRSERAATHFALLHPSVRFPRQR